MRNRLGATLFAVGALACTTSLAAAGDLVFEADRGIRRTLLSQSAEPPIREVKFKSQQGAQEEMLPSGMQPMMGDAAFGAVMASCEDGCCCSDGSCGECCGDPGCCGKSGCCDSGYCEPYCGDSYCCEPYCCPPQRGMCYAETQLMFLRAHIKEDAVGKLSEQYELTPRFIVGYETPSGLGIRGRYWMYDEATPNVQNGNDLSLNFDVIDLEGTSRFRTARSDLVIAGGFRWMSADIFMDTDSVRSEMPGITLAADMRSMICGDYRSEWAGVCGVRWSLLGGDWEGDNTQLYEPARDDNMNVTEIYGGFEYLRHYRGCDLFARIVFEVQNWHSDSLSQNAGADSIGFLGPGFHVGGAF